ncbi:tctex1 domain-containing protein 1-like [Cephus cinctus]|uniref:Tctex1 domain-containing protein 1-like n=1 Tax=Cephus cinctus TaxID=211228 RepID=A0AAJ7BV68_CEPCN|nr:tctex1 domain-containing protein 1-like [Cephus cinctus]
MSFMSRISVHQSGQSKLSKPMEMPPFIAQNKSSRATDSGPSRGTMSNMSLLLGYRASAVYRSTKGGFKVPRYQNTYRLASYNPFKCEVVDKILEDVMTMTLKGMKYNPAVCMKLCQDMSIEIRNRIFKKDYDRYKYVVTMTIIEKTGQSINMGLSRLWDVERDTYSTYIFENTDLYAVGAVIGLYYE